MADWELRSRLLRNHVQQPFPRDLKSREIFYSFLFPNNGIKDRSLMTNSLDWCCCHKNWPPLCFLPVKNDFYTISARQLSNRRGNFKVCSTEREEPKPKVLCFNHLALIGVTALENVCKQAVLSTWPRNASRHSSLFRTRFEFTDINWS